ncbi:hypothetical protein L596_018248 [Steinernema carpocapsae]|uniref:Uncharacterized protein n=1 Tax=Steinernema carpocapsae TaxID=34508 RepID=A0A4U5N4D7_STECR|nr:hypothetical protein L596_018248 [Steinernema carpocapsae]
MFVALLEMTVVEWECLERLRCLKRGLVLSKKRARVLTEGEKQEESPSPHGLPKKRQPTESAQKKLLKGMIVQKRKPEEEADSKAKEAGPKKKPNYPPANTLSSISTYSDSDSD